MPVGSFSFFPESGSKIISTSGEEWLRSGVISSPSGYAIAAAIEEMKVSGVAQVALPASVSVTSIASNGAGTFVAAYGDTTNVLVSTNGGVSWSTVAHNVAGSTAVTGVAYGGGRFVVVGNSAAVIRFAYSTTGTSFTTGATPGTITSGSAGTASIAHDGSGLFLAAVTGTGNTAVTTVDGTSASSFVITGALTAPKVAHNGTNWLVTSTTAGQYYTSPDGVTFTNQTGAAGAVSVGSVGGLFVSVPASGVAYYTSSTGATSSWTARSIPGIAATWPSGLQFGAAAKITYASGKLFVGIDSPSGGSPVVMWTSDGLSWSRRWTSIAAPGASSGWIVGYDGTKAVFMPTTSSAVATYTADFATADFIGAAETCAAGHVSGSHYLVGYVRIK